LLQYAALVRLGTLLLRNASIGLTQLESALRNQVLYGGRLGTNLVELGFLDVDLLSSYLADLSGVPSATPQMLDLAPADALARLGAELAHQLKAIPLGEVHERNGTVAVALVEPHDRQALTTLRSRFGAPISPYVMPELRAFYYLERHFGQPRQARFVRSGGRVTIPGLGPGVEPGARGPSALADLEDRRRSQPPDGLVMPPPLVVPPRRRRPSTLPAPLGGEPVVPFAAACERIGSATHRDQLADTLLSYAKGRVSTMLIMLVRDANAMVWRGYRSAVKGAQRLEDISVPLGSASAFQAAHDSLTTFSGAPPAPAHPVESQLWDKLGDTPEPLEVTVVPVVLKHRVVNLIYTHAAGGVAESVVEELTVLAQHMQDAYLRLIRQSKS
jgi:Type II secretion system (T2SS), protein E, N-terminal domain